MRARYIISNIFHIYNYVCVCVLCYDVLIDLHGKCFFLVGLHIIFFHDPYLLAEIIGTM